MAARNNNPELALDLPLWREKNKDLLARVTHTLRLNNAAFTQTRAYISQRMRTKIVRMRKDPAATLFRYVTAVYKGDAKHFVFRFNSFETITRFFVSEQAENATSDSVAQIAASCVSWIEQERRALADVRVTRTIVGGKGELSEVEAIIVKTILDECMLTATYWHEDVFG